VSAQTLEVVLARLYADAPFRDFFLVEPKEALKEYSLTEDEGRDLIAIDRPGLLMASQSYLRKRRRHPVRNPRAGLPRQVHHGDNC
jgi:hypothetical protein